jgi:hypothetical protein
MSELLYNINGVPHRPDNAANIGITLNWDGNPEEAQLSVDKLVLSNQARSEVMRWKSTQGFHEGIPYTVTIQGSTGALNIEYYIDLTESPTFSDSTVEVTIKKRKAVDKFKQDADGLTFELLNRNRTITNILDVDYVIIKDDQEIQLLSLIYAAQALTRELINTVKIIADIAFESTTPFTLVAAILKAAYLLVYTAAITAALINMIIQVMEIICPRIRKLKACTVQQLIKQGVEYLGYQFASSTLTYLNKLTVIPVPIQKRNKSIFTYRISLLTQSFTKGYPTAVDTTPTLGSLIDAFCFSYNQIFRVIGNTVHIENRYHWYDQSGVTITNTLNLQDKRENQWTYNTGETWKVKYLKFTLDNSDVHTLDDVEFSDTEYQTVAINPINTDLVNIKGLVNITLPFATASRKTAYTFVESRALEVAKLGDRIVNLIGGNSNLASRVEGRTGLMQISQQHYTVTKLAWISNGRIPSNYSSYVGADEIYRGYHITNQVKEGFKIIYKATIPFSVNQFFPLHQNNVVIDDMTGEQLEILNFDWKPEDAIADIEYTVRVPNEAINIQTIRIDG